MQRYLRRAGLINDRGGYAAPKGDEKMNSSITTPAVYVGTYHQYNCGSIFGKWFDLTDFDDEDAFYGACRTLHAGEEDPELMFQTSRASRHSLPLNPLLSGRLLRLSGRHRTTGAPPRLWLGGVYRRVRL